METQKIPLYKVRQFGEKISDTFAFVSENLKPLLKYITYFMLPVALVMGLAMNGYLNSVLHLAAIGDEVSPETLVELASSFGGVIVALLVGYPLLSAVVYGLMRVYGERENRLRGLTWAEFKPVFMPALKRSFKLLGFALLLGLLVSAVAGALVFVLGTALRVLFLAVIYIALLVVLVPISLMTPIYLFEDDIMLMGALKKAMRLGFRTWGGIFAVMFVLGLIVGIVSGIISLPWSIALGAQAAFGMEEDAESFVGTTGFGFIVFLLSVLQSFVSFLCYAVPTIGLAYQYGHAAEKIDHVTVEADIDKFENL